MCVLIKHTNLLYQRIDPSTEYFWRLFSAELSGLYMHDMACTLVF